MLVKGLNILDQHLFVAERTLIVILTDLLEFIKVHDPDVILLQFVEHLGSSDCQEGETLTVFSLHSAAAAGSSRWTPSPTEVMARSTTRMDHWLRHQELNQHLTIHKK